MSHLPTFVRAALVAGGFSLMIAGSPAHAQRWFAPGMPHINGHPPLPRVVPPPVTNPPPTTRPPTTPPPTTQPPASTGSNSATTNQGSRFVAQQQALANARLMALLGPRMFMIPTMPAMDLPMNPTFLINQLTQETMINELSRLAMPNQALTNQGTTNQGLTNQNQFPPTPVSAFLNPYLYGSYGGYGGYPGTNNYPSYSNNSEPSYSTTPTNKRPSVPDLPEPSPEVRNRLAQQVTLQRALSDAPVSEITSGAALNSILAELQSAGLTRSWKDLPSTGLDMPADMLAQINVTRNGVANAGILKEWEHVTWPAALNGPEFKLQRQQVDDLLEIAFAEVQSDGRVKADVIQKLNDSVDALQQQLRDNTVNLSFDTHQEAKTFVNNLQAAVNALQRPDIASFMNGQFQIKAKTIPELVQWMTDNGLQFAPAMPGEETAYTTLRQRLAAYDLNLRATAVTEPAQPAPSKVTP